MPSMPLPTPIQALSLQHTVGSAQKPLNVRPGQADQPRQLLLGSSTGSGKTLAYLLPLLHFLKKTDAGPRSSNADSAEATQIIPRAVVICPTHELTRQLTGVAKALSHGAKLSVRGMSSTSSGMTRFGHVDVLLGTSRAISKGLEKDWIAKQQVEWVVIDEADVLLGKWRPHKVHNSADVCCQVRNSKRKRNRSSTSSQRDAKRCLYHHHRSFCQPQLFRLPCYHTSRRTYRTCTRSCHRHSTDCLQS